MISFAAPDYSRRPGCATARMPHPGHAIAMTQSTRKLLGTFLVLGSIFVYAGIVMWVYASVLEGQAWYVLIAFFAVSGIGWFFPASWIIRWMAKPDT